MKLTDFTKNAYMSAAGKVRADGAEKNPDGSELSSPVKETAPEDTAGKKALGAGGLLKVPKKTESGEESVYSRVAKFLILIGTDEAAKVLSHLSESQTAKIVPYLASIKSVDKAEAEEILNEFQSLLERSRESGGVEQARTILEKAFGEEKAGELLEKAVPFKNSKPFAYLSEADDEKISLLLKDESFQVKAIVLSYLEPAVSAKVIQKLPEDEKKEVVMHLARMKKINPETLKRVDAAIEKKMNLVATEKADSIDGKSVLAEILKRMQGDAEEKLLNALGEQDSSLSEELRERLFTTEDILNADDRYIQKKLHSMDDSQVAFLIAGKDEKFREKMLSNVSENRRKQILDEENILMPMRKSDVETVTSRFYSELRRDWEDGKLIIKGRNEEIYV